MPGFEPQGWIIVHYPIPNTDLEYDDDGEEAPDLPNERHIYTVREHLEGLTSIRHPVYDLNKIEQEKMAHIVSLLLV